MVRSRPSPRVCANVTDCRRHGLPTTPKGQSTDGQREVAHFVAGGNSICNVAESDTTTSSIFLRHTLKSSPHVAINPSASWRSTPRRGSGFVLTACRSVPAVHRSEEPRTRTVEHDAFHPLTATVNDNGKAVVIAMMEGQEQQRSRNELRWSPDPRYQNVPPSTFLRCVHCM